MNTNTHREKRELIANVSNIMKNKNRIIYIQLAKFEAKYFIQYDIIYGKY